MHRRSFEGRHLVIIMSLQFIELTNIEKCLIFCQFNFILVDYASIIQIRLIFLNDIGIITTYILDQIKKVSGSNGLRGQKGGGTDARPN